MQCSCIVFDQYRLRMNTVPGRELGDADRPVHSIGSPLIHTLMTRQALSPSLSRRTRTLDGGEPPQPPPAIARH